MKRAWIALLALLALPAVTASGADFTAASASPGNSFTAAADFNTVTVALEDPGTPLQGAVELEATAASGRGIDAVRFQRAPAGTTTWTEICADDSAPYTCTWSGADGTYDLRAQATDDAGYTRSAVVAARVVDNLPPTVTLADPGQHLGGVRTLTATAGDAGTGLHSVRIQHRAPGGAWADACTSASCAWSTTAAHDGPRELRAVAVDRLGRVTETTPITRNIDNTEPTATPTYPSQASGNVTVSATASDSGSGIAAVAFEVLYGGGWIEVCRDTAAPYECSVDSTVAADGVYSARAVAIDNAGVRKVGDAFTVRVDNTKPATGPFTVPAGTLTGSVALTGAPTDGGAGVASWTVQQRRAGQTTWSTACSDSAAPWAGCSWSTVGLADGSYELRVRVVDGAGNFAESAIVTRTVDG